MDEQAQLAALMDLVEELGITIRLAPSADDSAQHPGGAIVKIKGKEVVFLDTEAALGDQIAILATALNGRKELEGRFLPPELRGLIDAADKE